MRKIISFSILCLLICCHSQKGSEKLWIDSNNVSSIWIKCRKQAYAPRIQDKLYEVDKKEYGKIIGEINSTLKGVLPDSSLKRKWENREIITELSIVLKSKDTIHLDFFLGTFMWRDSVYETDLGSGGYLYRNLCIKCSEDGLSLDSLWSLFLLENNRSGCLVGGQDVEKGRFGGDGCVLTSNPFWRAFLDRPKEVLTPFLVNKFSSTKGTYIHVCPFEKATEGELAVYCLHKIYLKNWFDFKTFEEFKDRETTSAGNNTQTWLREILRDENKRVILKDLWIEEMNKMPK